MGARWTRRAVGLGVLLALVLVALWATDTEPDLPGLVLVVALGVAVVWLVVDTLVEAGPAWEVGAAPPVRPEGADPTLTAYLRVVEDHFLARDPSPALRDRLAALAERRLRHRHGLTLADPAAATVLGVDLVAALTGPVRRLTRAELDAYVRRIEEL